MATFGECLDNQNDFKTLLLKDFRDVVDSFGIESAETPSDCRYWIGFKKGLTLDTAPPVPEMFRDIKVVPHYCEP
ncbi:MAG TPA: hypothetical protein VIG74_05545 [Alphaproteobacteria bacterium]|jgi:hypothetical protein